VLPHLERSLALLDADPASRTFGCCDRPFWHQRTLVDFPGATWQQLALAWCLVYADRGPDNPWAGEKRLLTGARAALGWWASIQHRDGSFDEWYRNEHSYCPTAFTAAGAALCLHLAGGGLGPVRPRVAAALERAGAWLARRHNPEVMNQNLAAALALWGLARLGGGGRWGRLAEDRLALAARRQSQEGWLDEYGGADLGYSTLALDLLAALDALAPCQPARDLARGLAGFLDQAAGEQPCLPGRLGSRGTAHAFAYGAEHFAAELPAAARLARLWRRAHGLGLAPAPARVDDRYLAYFHLPQLALAFARATPRPPGSPSPAPGEAWLPQAGLEFAPLARGWRLAVSHRLGGALALTGPEHPPLYHLGYTARAGDGRLFASNWWRPAGRPGQPAEAGFRRASEGQPLVRWSGAFHLLTRALASGRAAERFQALLKRRLVSPAASLGLALSRRWRVEGDLLTLRDELTAEPGLRLRGLWPTADISMHSPSARQDAGGLLDCGPWDPAEAARRLARRGRLVIGLAYRLEPEGPRLAKREWD
jgi:hypothetical protein